MGNTDEGRRYIAYRSQADYFEIEFFGGPLDGSKITTDIFPDCDLFIHRLHGRKYVYEYHRAGPTRFRAKWHGFETSNDGAARVRTNWWRTCLVWLWRLVGRMPRR